MSPRVAAWPRRSSSTASRTCATAPQLLALRALPVQTGADPSACHLRTRPAHQRHPARAQEAKKAAAAAAAEAQVVAEALAQAAAQVMGLDTAITVAGQSGNFQLNVMLPLVASNLLTSITLMSNTAKLLAERAIATFKVREDNLQVPLARNPILVTALNSVIGYNAAAAIAKKAYQAGRPIIDIAEEETDLDRATLERLLDPTVLTQGGLPE